MEKVRLNIVGMSYSQSQSGAYALILGEESGDRKLPIIIGSFEAQAIAIKLEDIETSRPLTHDLFKSFVESFNITIEEIVINKFIDGVFHAELVCRHEEKILRIDSRTSDAVAIALRNKTPIYTTEDIMKKASIIIDQEEKEKSKTVADQPDDEAKNPLSKLSLPELKSMMDEAIGKEDFERASKIRDEINLRSKKK